MLQVFALQTLVNGIQQCGEPGIFVAFEENSREILQNAATFPWQLDALVADGRLAFVDAHLSPDTVTGGAFDLTVLLAGLQAQALAMGATRIVFDAVDVRLATLADPKAMHHELYRLHEWLRSSQLTGIVTARMAEVEVEAPEQFAFLHYMADCVLLLSYRLSEHMSMRTFRVIKYRGSSFAEYEFPLTISADSLAVDRWFVEVDTRSMRLFPT